MKSFHIPLTFLAQGNYLGRVLNPKKIKFENELSKKYVKKSIKLITPEYFLRNKKNYYLILNCDSLTEININLAQKTSLPFLVLKPVIVFLLKINFITESEKMLKLH